jgi:COP9 signalosome complex subunit 12
MPPLSAYPQAHQVTFKYYSGVIAFLQEDYAAAEEFLISAYEMCNVQATKNLDLILTYLIPTKLLTSHRLPTKAILERSPSLDRLFTPIIQAIKRADLNAFTAAMEAGEDEFVKRRIYLTLERGRDIILRNLFRKVFVAGGYEPVKEGEAGPPVRRTRVPVKEFAAALRMAGAEIDDGDGGVDGDEVECLIANSIYKVCLNISGGESDPFMPAVAVSGMLPYPSGNHDAPPSTSSSGLRDAQAAY